MTLDALDAAFIDRWRAAAPPPGTVLPPVAPPAPAPAPAPVPAPTQAAGPTAAAACEPSLVDRLLAEAAPQWQAIADRIEAARGRGRRVIAVAGCDRGEGRTTLLAAVVRVLRSRGREVVVVEPGDLPTTVGVAHDKRIVLVDAGVWFPPGPIRRQRLLFVSHGCEAVVVVRRAGRPVAPAIEAALEAIGVEPLGEVVTFTGDEAAVPPEATR
jgi:hypothetical protein